MVGLHWSNLKVALPRGQAEQLRREVVARHNLIVRQIADRAWRRGKDYLPSAHRDLAALHDVSLQCSLSDLDAAQNAVELEVEVLRRHYAEGGNSGREEITAAVRTVLPQLKPDASSVPLLTPEAKEIGVVLFEGVDQLVWQVFPTADGALLEEAERYPVSEVVFSFLEAMEAWPQGTGGRVVTFRDGEYDLDWDFGPLGTDEDYLNELLRNLGDPAYADPDMDEFNNWFEEVASSLHVAAATFRRNRGLDAWGPPICIDKVDARGWSMPDGASYGVLFDTLEWRPFAEEIERRGEASALVCAFVVAASTDEFTRVTKRISSDLPLLHLVPFEPILPGLLYTL